MVLLDIFKNNICICSNHKPEKKQKLVKINPDHLFAGISANLVCGISYDRFQATMKN